MDGIKLGPILTGIIGGAATTYLDIWQQQEAAKAQERVLMAQAELERARAETMKALAEREAAVAEEKPGIDIMPILIIGAILLLASK